MELMEETGLTGLTSTDSISKGVFAFKRGNKRNANTKKKRWLWITPSVTEVSNHQDLLNYSQKNAIVP